MAAIISVVSRATPVYPIALCGLGFIKSQLSSGNKPLLIDARLPEDRDAPMVMVCGVRKFSKKSLLHHKSMGYRNVRSLKGGVNEWVR